VPAGGTPKRTQTNRTSRSAQSLPDYPPVTRPPWREPGLQKLSCLVHAFISRKLRHVKNIDNAHYGNGGFETHPLARGSGDTRSLIVPAGDPTNFTAYLTASLGLKTSAEARRRYPPLPAGWHPVPDRLRRGARLRYLPTGSARCQQPSREGTL